MFRKPLLCPLNVFRFGLEVHVLGDDVDALEQGQPLRDQVCHVNQERTIFRVTG
jgi:hypothetical protein